MGLQALLAAVPVGIGVLPDLNPRPSFKLIPYIPRRFIVASDQGSLGNRGDRPGLPLVKHADPG
jgi:hypothetical protein